MEGYINKPLPFVCKHMRPFFLSTCEYRVCVYTYNVVAVAHQANTQKSNNKRKSVRMKFC